MHLRLTHLPKLRQLRQARWLSLLAVTMIAMLLLAACQANVTPPQDPTPAPATATAPATSSNTTEVAPFPQEQATGPVRLQIPDINLNVPVIAMGWRVDVVNGARTTVWDVPTEEAGWHINSAGAGAEGNTVISGRQVGGAAVFAPLALGSVTLGQEIRLTDGDGIVFTYRITEVTDPIPVTGATPAEIAQAASYFAPTADARLTLVAGWPEFTTTHRVFLVAEFVGVQR